LAKTPRTWTGARTPSGLKRVRNARRRHEVLQPRRTAAKTYVAKALTAATQPSDGIDPQQALAEALSALDRAAKAGAIHPNAAARRKSRLTIKINAAVGGVHAGHGGRVAKTTGKAAHSAYPEEGDSAIEKLLDILDDIRHTKFPNDEFFGETTVNIGTIEGGMALNVIPPKAEAGLAIRLTTKKQLIEDALRSVIRDRGEMEVLSYSEPVRMLEVDGFDKKVVRFTTDIPHLPKWGKPLLLGPGSILVAHTKDEFVLKKDLDAAVGLYVDLAKRLLTNSASI